MKRDNKILIITTLICLVPMILGLMMYSNLPAKLPIHFDDKGNANGYMAKNIAIWFLPVLMAGINALTHFMLNADPKRKNASVAIRNLGLWTAPVLSCVLMPVTLFKAVGYNIPIEILSSAIVGIVIIACGNYMPKCKQNYTVGIKLPWTLNDEDNWNKTHRLAGYLWMAGGLVILVLAFINSYTIYVSLSIVAVLVVVPTVYSYRISKN